MLLFLRIWSNQCKSHNFYFFRWTLGNQSGRVSSLKSSRQDELKLIGGKMKHFKVGLWSSQNWNKHRQDLFNYLCLWDLFCESGNIQPTYQLGLWSHQTYRLSHLAGSVLGWETSKENLNIRKNGTNGFTYERLPSDSMSQCTSMALRPTVWVCNLSDEI